MPNIQASGLLLCTDSGAVEIPSTHRRLSNLDLGRCPICLLLQLCDRGNSPSLNASASAVQKGVSPLHRKGSRITATCCMPRQSWPLAPHQCLCLFKSKLHCLGNCLALLPVVSFEKKKQNKTNFLSFSNITLFYYMIQKCFSS